MLIDRMIEWIIRVVAWTVQIGAVLLAAAIICVLLFWGVETLLRKKRGRFLPRFLVTLILICIVLAALALKPPVICPERYESYLTPERRIAVQSGGSGVYSWNIPLVPVCIKITDINNFVVDGKMEYCVEYTIFYFCFGSMGMEYSTHDGYSSNPMFGA